MDGVAHMPIRDIGVGSAGIRHWSSGQISVIYELTLRSQRQKHLLIDEGLTHLGQDRDKLLRFSLRQGGKRATDTTVIRPSRLPPGLRYSLILIQWVCRIAEVLEMRPTTQNRYEKLEHLALWRMIHGFLAQRYRFKLGDQLDALGKLPPGQQ
ncbi:MAG: hypothetical protein BWY63_03827 [Chloroflexi bacterium ADurb.Bin360]|nr:MAG: hypothetical protein BWY63_03827 [Chloroflexi bacterium ADurb.Bin360]